MPHWSEWYPRGLPSRVETSHIETMRLALGSKEKQQFVFTAVILTLVLVGTLLGLADWRYKLSFQTPETSEFDRGFRWNRDERRCENAKREGGDSPGFLGPCGRISDQVYRRVKLFNHSAVAFTAEGFRFDRFYFEWFDGFGSRWWRGEFSRGEFFEVDMPYAQFKNVVFDGVQISGARFYGATFEDCVFRNVELVDATFRDAKFLRTRFENTDCDLCDFGGAEFLESEIQGSMTRAYYNENSALPFPIEDAGLRGFQYRK